MSSRTRLLSRQLITILSTGAMLSSSIPAHAANLGSCQQFFSGTAQPTSRRARRAQNQTPAITTPGQPTAPVVQQPTAPAAVQPAAPAEPSTIGSHPPVIARPRSQKSKVQSDAKLSPAQRRAQVRENDEALRVFSAEYNQSQDVRDKVLALKKEIRKLRKKNSAFETNRYINRELDLHVFVNLIMSGDIDIAARQFKDLFESAEGAYLDVKTKRLLIAKVEKQIADGTVGDKQIALANITLWRAEEKESLRSYYQNRESYLVLASYVKRTLTPDAQGQYHLQDPKQVADEVDVNLIKPDDHSTVAQIDQITSTPPITPPTGPITPVPPINPLPIVPGGPTNPVPGGPSGGTVVPTQVPAAPGAPVIVVGTGGTTPGGGTAPIVDHATIPVPIYDQNDLALMIDPGATPDTAAINAGIALAAQQSNNGFNGFNGFGNGVTVFGNGSSVPLAINTGNPGGVGGGDTPIIIAGSEITANPGIGTTIQGQTGGVGVGTGGVGVGTASPIVIGGTQGGTSPVIINPTGGGIGPTGSTGPGAPVFPVAPPGNPAIDVELIRKLDIQLGGYLKSSYFEKEQVLAKTFLKSKHELKRPSLDEIFEFDRTESNTDEAIIAELEAQLRAEKKLNSFVYTTGLKQQFAEVYQNALLSLPQNRTTKLLQTLAWVDEDEIMRRRHTNSIMLVLREQPRGVGVDGLARVEKLFALNTKYPGNELLRTFCRVVEGGRVWKDMKDSLAIQAFNYPYQQNQTVRDTRMATMYQTMIDMEAVLKTNRPYLSLTETMAPRYLLGTTEGGAVIAAASTAYWFLGHPGTQPIIEAVGSVMKALLGQ